MRDMHSNITVVAAIAPQTVSTTGAAGGRTSGIIDRRGYDAVEFFAARGVSAAATDTVNFLLTEANATNATFTSVADADLRGTEAGAVMLGSTAAVSKLGYVGNKRYLKLKLYGLGTATSIVSAVAALGSPAAAPVA